MTDPCDLAIIGGGPAGMAAARIAAREGLAVTIIDEQPRPGGQILRQPPAGYTVPNWLPGRAYHRLKAEMAAFCATAGIDWLGGQSVVGLQREHDRGAFAIGLSSGWDMTRVRARRVLIATGCYDLPVPLPGWTLPGVMTVGGVQAFVKSQQIVPGDRFVLAGTHPLMLVVAAQLVEAGGEVALVAFDQPLPRMLEALWRRARTSLRHLPTLAAGATAMRVLARHGVPVRYGMPVAAIDGVHGVTGVRFGAGELVACDRVALCYGFVPQSDLPRLAGASVRWAARTGGWNTLYDPWMRSDVEGLSVAGETTGVAGAEIAMLEGRLAALGILLDEGRLTPAAADARARPVRRALAARGRFAELLGAIADPSAVLARAPQGDTILCRCEDVRFDAVDAVLGEPMMPNAVKLMTRVGMGACQGRICEGALLCRIAVHGGTAVGATGGFTARYPVRPVRIGDLIDVAPAATTSDTNLA